MIYNNNNNKTIVNKEFETKTNKSKHFNSFENFVK